MATRYWSPTADGNFQTAANWLDAAGAPSGAAPANSDTLIFNQGSIDVNAGLTNSLTGLIIVVLSQYTGSIGTLGAALVSTSFASISGAMHGRFYKFSGTGTAIDIVVGHSTVFYLTSGEWGTSTSTTPLRTGGPGQVVMEAAATFASGSHIHNAGSHWIVAAGTDTNKPTVENEMGTMVFRRDCGAVNNSPGAIFRFEVDATSSSILRNWGTYYHWTTATDLVMHSKSRSQLIVKGTKAITPTITTMFRSAGATIQDRQGGARLTITNDIPVGDVTAATRAMVAT